ncbi:MIEF1 upstream open reading frame protein isoform X2 [Frankliniella occidentalis]|uniref:MIEF1 upstream open reading frame protein isoform X2 n=1 Tax=Frankliniella occidentalis TaxID=133901 RepID=A0A6J1S7C3_FRAOC|nr:MIEF1 upstream open reading frame protein isoform X2 [Frankliniella occidentalis]XP_052123888.1 MIEF1 upstream open reading frame protein isoform X2 [Frankliniella occidentalis]
MTTLVSPTQVLQLYRSLIRYGQNLQLTDKQYYLRRVREEFRANKDLQAPEKIEFMFKKGQSLLQRKRLI